MVREDGVRARTRIACVLSLIVAAACCLAQASRAQASMPSFTWAGRSTVSENWSVAKNWEGNTAPTASASVGTLTFPRLTSTECTAEEETHPCYFSFNDLSGLTAEALDVDDGNSYLIGGEKVTLGSGGLTASPAGGVSGPAGDFMLMPLGLSAAQTWSIAGRSAGGIGEDGVFFGGDVTGSGNALTLELSDGSAVFLENSTEVGPVTIDGADAAEAGVFNGFVALEDGELDSSDLEPVSVRHTLMFATGAVGPLTTDDAELDVGSGLKPAEALEAPSVKLDSASRLGVEISGAGTAARQDYSQLLSHGSIDLENASIEVVVHPPEEGKPCPTLVPGTTYTFISTTGALSGSFANAPEHGAEIPIRFAQACSQASHKLRIAYHENGATKTVTGTVDAEAKETQEQEAKEKQEQEAKETQERQAKETQEREAREQEARQQELLKRLVEEHTKQVGEEAAKHEQEAAAAAGKRQAEEAAARQRQQEEAARAGVLGAKAGVPDATIATTSLQATASGAVSIKIRCPVGESSCLGTVTLHTLNAVSASRAGMAAKKTVLTLATGSFSVPGGALKTVTLHLSAKARVLLGRSHLLHVRATVVAHDPVGATHTGQAIVTLRAPKMTHRTG
jgi:hypothetical protein